jgi:dipeptidyl aminopeptidase/acylaminoacyl peptidase
MNLTKSFVALIVACSLVQAIPAASQSLAPFTAGDLLDVTTLAILDLSEDGRRVAATTRRLRDNATTDHRRFGDPSYVAPASLELLVIDTTSGAIDRPFSNRRHIRQASFSRDGRRLAILTVVEDGEGLPRTSLYVWDAERRALSQVPVAGEAQVSPNSGLVWRPDASALLVTMRTLEQERRAQAAFRLQVNGPVVVHSSAEPFLEWDTFRREDRSRRLVALDPSTGNVREVLPETRLTSYQVARDGSFVTLLEDATEKTDYDVIFATHNAVKHVPLGAGSPASVQTLVEAKTLKTAMPRWSDDGRVLAWAEKGEVFVQGIGEDAARSVTPRPDAKEATEPAGTAIVPPTCTSPTRRSPASASSRT